MKNYFITETEAGAEIEIYVFLRDQDGHSEETKRIFIDKNNFKNNKICSGFLKSEIRKKAEQIRTRQARSSGSYTKIIEICIHNIATGRDENIKNI